MIQMDYYKNIFSLKNKIVFVIGGSGLIGIEAIKSLRAYGAKIINIDVKKNKSCKMQLQGFYFMFVVADEPVAAGADIATSGRLTHVALSVLHGTS